MSKRGFVDNRRIDDFPESVPTKNELKASEKLDYLRRKAVKPKFAVKLLSTSIKREHGYLFIHGFFVNRSNREMKNVVAAAECFSPEGALVLKTKTIIDDRVVKPRQVSSFHMVADDKPIERAYVDRVNVSFKQVSGQEIEVFE